MNYTANDIVSLSAGRAFREKLGMYLSADRQEAINLGLRELIVNVQDEYEVYKPKNPTLKVELNSKTREITVTDNMRGIPVGIRDDGMNSLTAAFLIPHSGGKHQEGVYSSAVGINGEGNKIVCHTAKSLYVEVHRDGKIYSQKFESTDDGSAAITEVISKEDKIKPQITGTKIIYIPDERVYGEVFIDLPKLRNMLKEISYFTKGLKILLINDGKEETFYSENGLIDGLKNEKAISEPFSYFYETEDCKVELALQWVPSNGSIKGYANGLYMPDGGAFITGFKSSLTRTFNSLANKNFTGEQIRGVLDGFVSVKVKMGQFSNQAKTALANPEARTATSSAISLALKEFSQRNSQIFNKIVELLSKVERAEKAAERARIAVMESQKTVEKELKKKSILAGKLVDCEKHDETSQLLIVEGKSALGSIVNARDGVYTACFPLRGKIINVLKNTEEDIFNNEEVKELQIALGCGIGDKFNIKKLRYGRICIAADMDMDGYAIVCLVLTFFYKYYPELIRQGKIYWARTPLFSITSGGKTYYAYSEEELAKLPKGKVSRNKGLGELSALEMKDTLFSCEDSYVQFTMEDAAAASYYFNLLLGENVKGRREYIFENIDFEAVEE